jgi:hypothetical protein
LELLQLSGCQTRSRARGCDSSGQLIGQISSAELERISSAELERISSAELERISSAELAPDQFWRTEPDQLTRAVTLMASCYASRCWR